MKSKKNYLWQVAHIIICNTNIQVGCGGFGHGSYVDEALPLIQGLVDELNFIKDMSGDKAKHCELIEQGTYLHLMNLEGYNFLAADKLIAMLLEDGWEFGEIIDYTKTNPNYYQLKRIYMHRR